MKRPSSTYKLSRPDVIPTYPWKEVFAYGRGKDLKPSKVEQLTYFFMDYQIPEQGLGKPQMESIFRQWLKDKVSDSIVKKWCDLSFSKADKDNSGYLSLLEFIDIYVSDLRMELEKYVGEDEALGVSDDLSEVETPAATPDRNNDNATPFPSRQSIKKLDMGETDLFNIKPQETNNLESRPDEDSNNKANGSNSNNTDYLFYTNKVDDVGLKNRNEDDGLTGKGHGEAPNDSLTGKDHCEAPNDSLTGKDNEAPADGSTTKDDGKVEAPLDSLTGKGNGEAPDDNHTGKGNEAPSDGSTTKDDGKVEAPLDNLSGTDDINNKSSPTQDETEWKSLSEKERKELLEAYISKAAYYISKREPHTDSHSCWIQGEKEILSKFPYMCVVDRAK